MVNIVLTRIDDRLIHGQVMTSWVKATKATKIIIPSELQSLATAGITLKEMFSDTPDNTKSEK